MMVDLPRALIVEDHPLVAEGLRALLAPYCDMITIETDSRQIESAVTEYQPDLVLLDLSMPHRNGLEALPAVTRAFPHVKIIVVTMHVDRALAELSFAAGAHGFLPKEASADELAEAVRRVTAGERYLSPRVPQKGRTDRGALAEPALERLTPRQREILRYVGEGRTAAEIAEKLGLSPRTVEFHRSGIRDALGITSEWGLLHFAIRLRLGTSEEATPAAGT